VGSSGFGDGFTFFREGCLLAALLSESEPFGPSGVLLVSVTGVCLRFFVGVIVFSFLVSCSTKKSDEVAGTTSLRTSTAGESAITTGSEATLELPVRLFKVGCGWGDGLRGSAAADFFFLPPVVGTVADKGTSTGETGDPGAWSVLDSTKDFCLISLPRFLVRGDALIAGTESQEITTSAERSGTSELLAVVGVSVAVKGRASPAEIASVRGTALSLAGSIVGRDKIVSGDGVVSVLAEPAADETRCSTTSRAAATADVTLEAIDEVMEAMTGVTLSVVDDGGALGLSVELGFTLASEAIEESEMCGKLAAGGLIC